MAGKMDRPRASCRQWTDRCRRYAGLSEQDDADAGGDGALEIHVESAVEMLPNASVKPAQRASQQNDLELTGALPSALDDLVSNVR